MRRAGTTPGRAGGLAPGSRPWRFQALAAAVGTVVVLGLAAPVAADDDAAGALFVKSGRDLYLTYCAACHGTDGKGDGPVAASLRVRPADLTTIVKRHGGEFPAADMARTIDGRFAVPAHGPREMPVWGRQFGGDVKPESTADEIARGNISVLIDYLRTIQEPG